MPTIFRGGARVGKVLSGPKRATFRQRGYTKAWETYSAKFRQRNPLCARCFERDRPTLADVVDHKIPVREGGPLMDPSNHWSLCTACHSGWKARLERYAKRTDQVQMLRIWCDDPTTRPRFRGEID